MQAESLPPRRLPLGLSTFERLQREGLVYVDKTGLLYDLLRRGQKFLFTRPERFGKTLLITALESLFRHGLRDFKGLAIEKLWREAPAQTVVRLDFSRLTGFRDAAEFEARFDTLFAEVLAHEKAGPKSTTGSQGEAAFENWYYAQPASSTAVLIDACDAPLIDCVDRPEVFRDVRSLLANFYAFLKSVDSPLRFLFITGATEFAQISVFSGIDNLFDATHRFRSGALLGFTESELLEHFPQELERACRALELEQDELLQTLQRHYGGYQFEERTPTEVMAPEPVLRFLEHPERGFQGTLPMNARLEAALRRSLAESAPKDGTDALQHLLANAWVPNPAWREPLNPEHLAPYDFLAGAGCLTLQRTVPLGSRLRCPNLAAEATLSKLLKSQRSKESPRA